MIKKPSDWHWRTKDKWKNGIGISAVPAVIASFVCLIAGAAAHGPRTDAQTQATLRKAWVQVEQRIDKHDGTFGSFKDIKSAIDDNSNDNGVAGTVISGVGPAGVHDQGTDTILVDTHTTPKHLVLFAHSDSGRDWELAADLGKDPVLSTNTPGGPTHYNTVDRWKPIRTDGEVLAAFYGLIASIFAFFSIVGNSLDALSDYRGTRRQRRQQKIGLIRRLRAKHQLKRNRELSVQRWRELAGNGSYGPASPEAGWELFVADKEQRGSGDGEVLAFTVRRVRWNTSACDWIPVSDSGAAPTPPAELKTSLPAATDIGTATEAWFGFCSWVDTLNRSRWQARAEQQGIALPSAEGRLVDMLPSPGRMLDNGTEARQPQTKRLKLSSARRGN